MMKASLVITGTEITRGLVQDSHLKNISSMLRTIGVEVGSVFFIPDSVSIKKYIDYSAVDSDIIITTGGLGPTEDDRTRYAVADFAHSKLEKNKEALENVCAAVGAEKCNGSNLIQGMIPAGFNVIKNFNGSACGFWGRVNNNILISLPGPPKELNPMLSSVREILCRCCGSGDEPVSVYTLFAVSEAYFNDLSLKVIERMGRRAENLNIGTCFEEFKLLVYCYSSDKYVIEEYISLLTDMLKQDDDSVDFLYSGDCNIFIMLRDSLGKRKVSTAESITGGLISKCFTDIPGSSDWFISGIVSYCDEIKHSELGVSQHVLDLHSAVSSECASAMATGAEEKFKSDVTISVTGYAGPSGENVGQVYIGVKFSGKSTCVFGHKIIGSRNYIRRRTAVLALLHTIRMLREA